mmetsp:Transcript_24927/g.62588  ORF Transcript_24927/g.62588 Transcript_24927/m.62588 type:complete len:206 (+) Transcript_24927:2375-2992(+)
MLTHPQTRWRQGFLRWPPPPNMSPSCPTLHIHRPTRRSISSLSSRSGLPLREVPFRSHSVAQLYRRAVSSQPTASSSSRDHSMVCRPSPCRSSTNYNNISSGRWNSGNSSSTCSRPIFSNAIWSSNSSASYHTNSSTSKSTTTSSSTSNSKSSSSSSIITRNGLLLLNSRCSSHSNSPRLRHLLRASHWKLAQQQAHWKHHLETH